MRANKTNQRKSAFSERGLKKTVDSLLDEIRDLYLSDTIPWVVGYSGGKDSTAALQLVWMALEGLGQDQLNKPVHVISTDTLVENPVVAAWVSRSLEAMGKRSAESGLPITPHRLIPEVSDTFWVNLIGKGYPAPRPKFRWCTERLKIKPSNAFITSVVRQSGEAIIVLGTRKAESAARAQAMNKMAQRRTRDRLSPNPTLLNSLIFSPVEDWSNDDVWLFLMQTPNPWGYNNKDLLTMYQGASPDGECPLVLDTSTPSCGDSRFGCWVCTLVDEDRSMAAMVQNDEEKEWMWPLLKLRNALDPRDPHDKNKRVDKHLRDFRRLDGNVKLLKDGTVPGPYTQQSREMWLRMVLEAQQQVREEGPSHVKDIELITMQELHEIRRIWVVEKHEIEDNLPRIYEEVMGHRFPGGKLDDSLPFGADEIRLLEDSCGGDRLHFELARQLIDIERRYRSNSRRAGLFGAMEQAFRRNFYDNTDDAADRASRRRAVDDALASERVQPSGIPEERMTYLGKLAQDGTLKRMLEEINSAGEL